MGALTFKPHSFQVRPWELTKQEVPDYYDDQQNLIFHYRGSNLIQITSNFWLRDRVRFSYDGFRRQRLIYPTTNGNRISWASAMASWYNLVYSRDVNLMSDPVQPHLWWLVRLLGRFACLSIKGLAYSVDVNRVCQLYQGSYGLFTTNCATLVLPLFTPYEEDNFQFFSLSFVQVFRPKDFYYRCKFYPKHYHSKYFKISTSSFQVSPLQQLFLR